MSKFHSLKALLRSACAERDRLGAVGPNPRTDPVGAREWHVRRRKAVGGVRDASASLACLRPVDATAEELAEACALLGYDVETSNRDVAYWARGTRRLERSEWSIGQPVEILPALRMGPRPGDPMVESRDSWTGRKGKITGMTPDGVEVYLSCLADCEAVCIERLRALD
jgi:hypothetical protein